MTLIGLAGLSLLIWIWLLCFRGQFWRSDIVLESLVLESIVLRNSVLDIGLGEEPSQSIHAQFPSICAIIPARNEADLLPITLRSLLSQDYPGHFKVILVDDHSTDGTAEVAKQTAQAIGKADQLQVIAAQSLPAGWSGKLWAMEQGVRASERLLPNIQSDLQSSRQIDSQPEYLLFTDADIEHAPAHLQRLVTQAMQQNLDLASVMVRLRCESFWERLLIPAFVFFFEKLYPFRWVNDPRNRTAAAAGGCILIRKAALDRIGGLQTIRQALIDDCALAQAVKQDLEKPGEPEIPQHQQNFQSLFPIWLGLSDSTQSLRPYPSLKTIWDMVARTAFTQLNYSLLALIGTLAGMFLVYILPVLACLVGIAINNLWITLIGALTWGLMTLAYLPTIRFYRCHPLWAACLPIIALLYTCMTVDSALRYWQGRGGSWKGRVYSSPEKG